MLRILFTAVFALFAHLSVLAAPQSYVIDSLHSYPNFAVNHLGMTMIHGRFDKMAGKVVFDQAAKSGSLEVKIATASITTGDGQRADGRRSRDDHLRSADFFNVAEFPEMIYRSTKLNFNGDAVESIEGSLTLLGVTKPLKLNVSTFKCAAHPFSKKPMCGAYVEGMIKRSDFGMKFGIGSVSDEVKLSIGVEAYPE